MASVSAPDGEEAEPLSAESVSSVNARRRRNRRRAKFDDGNEIPSGRHAHVGASPYRPRTFDARRPDSIRVKLLKSSVGTKKSPDGRTDRGFSRAASGRVRFHTSPPDLFGRAQVKWSPAFVSACRAVSYAPASTDWAQDDMRREAAWLRRPRSAECGSCSYMR